MDINEEIKNFLLTSGKEYVAYIKERARLVEEEKLAWDRAELTSKLLDEHIKKNKNLDKKIKETLFKLVEAVNVEAVNVEVVNFNND
jgi:hypothetical protein